MDKPKVVVVGGGFGGLEALFNMRMRLGKRAEFVLVSDSEDFQFKPNTIYIPFGKPAERFRFALPELLLSRDIAFEHARATAVDTDRKVLTTSDGKLAYDYLVLATGAGMRPEEVPGLAENANTIWTPDDMLALRESLQALVAKAKAGTRQSVLFVVPPNNKCSGPLYEIAMMLPVWLTGQQAREMVDIEYTTFEQSYIMAFGPRLDELVQREFSARGIAGQLRWVVDRVEPGRVSYSNGQTRNYDLLIGFPPYIASTRFEGLEQDERGFLKTNPVTRQLADHQDIYVAGDAGDFPVKQAFLALLQADTVAEHICQRVLHEEPSARFDPVSMCIMEQFDKATFAQVPLRETGDPQRPVEVRQDDIDLYKVGSGTLWRMGKKMLGAVLPSRFRHGRPFHAGATWSMMEAGLKVMSSAFAE